MTFTRSPVGRAWPVAIALRAAGWAGVMTLPRLLSLAADGRKPPLRTTPAPEIETLRLNHRRRGEFMLDADSELSIDEIRGDSLEIQLEMETIGAREFGLVVRRSPDGAEQTRLFYDAATKTFRVDGEKASFVADEAPFVPVLPPDERKIHVQAAPFESSAGAAAPS